MISFLISTFLFQLHFNGNRICVLRVVLLVEMDKDKRAVYLHTNHVLYLVVGFSPVVHILHHFLKESVVNLYSLRKYHSISVIRLIQR